MLARKPADAAKTALQDTIGSFPTTFLAMADSFRYEVIMAARESVDATMQSYRAQWRDFSKPIAPPSGFLGKLRKTLSGEPKPLFTRDRAGNIQPAEVFVALIDKLLELRTLTHTIPMGRRFRENVYELFPKTMNREAIEKLVIESGNIGKFSSFEETLYYFLAYVGLYHFQLDPLTDEEARDRKLAANRFPIVYPNFFPIQEFANYFNFLHEKLSTHGLDSVPDSMVSEVNTLADHVTHLVTLISQGTILKMHWEPADAIEPTVNLFESIPRTIIDYTFRMILEKLNSLPEFQRFCNRTENASLKSTIAEYASSPTTETPEQLARKVYIKSGLERLLLSDAIRDLTSLNMLRLFLTSNPDSYKSCLEILDTYATPSQKRILLDSISLPFSRALPPPEKTGGVVPEFISTASNFIEQLRNWATYFQGVASATTAGASALGSSPLTASPLGAAAQDSDDGDPNDGDVTVAGDDARSVGSDRGSPARPPSAAMVLAASAPPASRRPTASAPPAAQVMAMGAGAQLPYSPEYMAALAMSGLAGRPAAAGAGDRLPAGYVPTYH